MDDLTLVDKQELTGKEADIANVYQMESHFTPAQRTAFNKEHGGWSFDPSFHHALADIKTLSGPVRKLFPAQVKVGNRVFQLGAYRSQPEANFAFNCGVRLLGLSSETLKVEEIQDSSQREKILSEVVSRIDKESKKPEAPPVIKESMSEEEIKGFYRKRNKRERFNTGCASVHVVPTATHRRISTPENDGGPFHGVEQRKGKYLLRIAAPNNGPRVHHLFETALEAAYGYNYCAEVLGGRTRSGKPLGQSNVLRRTLHPILKELGEPQCGAHAFRRFRLTHIREHGVPKDLEHFWMGHTDEEIGDIYSMLKQRVEYRKKWADQLGLGFEIPSKTASIGPNGPKIETKPVSEMAASV